MDAARAVPADGGTAPSSRRRELLGCLLGFVGCVLALWLLAPPAGASETDTLPETPETPSPVADDETDEPDETDAPDEPGGDSGDAGDTGEVSAPGDPAPAGPGGADTPDAAEQDDVSVPGDVGEPDDVGVPDDSASTPGGDDPPATLGTPAVPEPPAEETMPTATDAPECPECSSTITQALVERTFLTATNQWQLVIEATVDSNVVCHLFLFQCVVQPQQSPTNLSLVRVQCLSDGWAHVLIDVLGFTRDVCARFDHRHAGNDQRFRFTYRTDPGIVSGSVRETAIFYRFPEEVFFVRARDTITIDLDANVTLTKVCPDVVTAGTSSSCTIALEYAGEGPGVINVIVSDTAPTAFTNGTLTFESGSGTWNCVALTCTIVGSFDPGDHTAFTFAFDVAVNADGQVTNVAAVVYDDGGLSESVTAERAVTIRRPTDTDVTVDKVADETAVVPGAPISWTITVTNHGPVDALNVRVTDVPSEFVEDVFITFASGVGTWACDHATLTCTAATMPLGTATFAVAGTVGASTPPGTVLVNEADVEWDNDVFGPDFPIRVGAQVAVVEPPAPVPPEPTPAAPTPPRAGTGIGTGGGTGAGVLPITGGDAAPVAALGLVLLLVGAVLRRVGAAPRPTG